MSKMVFNFAEVLLSLSTYLPAYSTSIQFLESMDRWSKLSYCDKTKERDLNTFKLNGISHSYQLDQYISV